MTKEQIKIQRETIQEILAQTVADLQKGEGITPELIASEFLVMTIDLCLQSGGYLGAADVFARAQQVIIQGAADLWIKERGKNVTD